MSSNQDHGFGGHAVPVKGTHRSEAQLFFEGYLGGAVAQPGAVVYVVVANHSALKLLAEIDLLVENLAAGEHSHPAAAVLFDDLFQLFGGSSDGLIPGSFHQLISLADKGVGEPFFAGNKFMDGKAFDAQVFVVHCLVSTGGAALDRNSLVVKLQLQIAAHPTVGTYDRNRVWHRKFLLTRTAQQNPSRFS